MGDCHTEVKYNKTVFKWTISKFCLQFPDEKQLTLQSVEFSTKFNNVSSTWYLTLEMNVSKDVDSNDWISVDLHLVTSDIPEVTAKYRFYVLNAQKEEALIWTSDKSKLFIVKDKTGWGTTRFCRRDSLLKKPKLFPKDVLTLCCEVIELGSIMTRPKKRKLSPEPIPPMFQDYKRLFESKEASDFSIVVDKEEFQVHKAVLLARCPVFVEKHDMIEDKDRNWVKIDGIDHGVCKNMLQYVYTNERPPAEDMTADLLAVADEYKLMGLKRMCEEQLFSGITVENAAETLIWASRYNSKQLTNWSIGFINKNKTDVIKTAKFKEIEKSQPNLLKMLYRATATE